MKKLFLKLFTFSANWPIPVQWLVIILLAVLIVLLLTVHL